MSDLYQAFGRNAAALVAAVALAGASAAHPHVFIDARYRIDMPDGANIQAIEVEWTFDSTYSFFLFDGVDTNKDGTPDEAEMKAFAADIIESLAEYGWFVEMRAGEKPVAASKPQVFGYRYADDRFTLYFTLPLAEAVNPRTNGFEFSGYDPFYYIDMVIPTQGDVAIVGTTGCDAVVVNPEMRQTTLGGGTWQQGIESDAYKDSGYLFAQRVDIRC